MSTHVTIFCFVVTDKDICRLATVRFAAVARGRFVRCVGSRFEVVENKLYLRKLRDVRADGVMIVCVAALFS